MKKYKHPRTPHLPWSPGATSDDKVIYDISIFYDKEIVITEKMDGENTTMYRDGFHARSLDSNNHSSRSYVKGLWGQIAHLIPEGWRICGENLYAKHSIHYKDLRSYFYVFSIWNDKNICLSWVDTVYFCSSIGLEIVNEWYQGQWGDQTKPLKSYYIGPFREGYVIRNAGQFHYDDFSKNVAKYVRDGHVPDDAIHWSKKPLIKNVLI